MQKFTWLLYALLYFTGIQVDRTDHVDIEVRFRGGRIERIQESLPVKATDMYRTPQKAVDMVDELLENYTCRKIAKILNEQNISPGRGKKFNGTMVSNLSKIYGLKPRRERLREKGYLTLEEISKQLKVGMNTVQIWKRNGMLKSYAYNDKNECLFESPGEGSPTKQQGLRFDQRKQYNQFCAD